MSGYPRSGFTLVEAMIVLALIAITVFFAVPGFGRLIESHAAYAANHQLITSLNLARHHALENNIPVVSCRSRTQRACASSGRWNRGWIIFEDPQGLNNCQDSDGDSRCDSGGGRILHRSTGPEDGLVIVTNNNIRNRVRFNAQGMTPGYTGRFTICGRRRGPLRGIVVPQTGRFRPARPGELLSCP
ncbi:GspH/FimT family pseudopilin [Aquisalimonas lutea]|uniref:GspH/FimT family pseudopilin n=1 Tax=Aquisalimonas lutea TaxID=1327750 RepID=UPI00338F8BA8